MSDSGVPAQWADDPSGRHRFRYWDGERWTGHVYDGPHPPNHPPRAEGESVVVGAPAAGYADHGDEYAADVEPADGLDDETGGRRGRGGGGGGRGPSDPVRSAFIKGAAAGGAAVALIAILATVALGGGGDDKTSTTSTTKEEATTTSAPTTTLAAVTTTLPAGRPPSEVRVLVLNGSGVGGAASTMQDQLKKAGYQVPNIGNADTVTGTTVACKAGFENDAPALAAAVGKNATVGAYPSPAPANDASVDCVVTLGQ